MDFPLFRLAFFDVLEAETWVGGGSASMQVEDELFGQLCHRPGVDDETFSTLILAVSARLGDERGAYDVC